MKLLNLTTYSLRARQVVFCFTLLTLCLTELSSITLAADSVVLEETEQQKWYKGNLHTHSLWSDGDDDHHKFDWPALF